MTKTLPPEVVSEVALAQQSIAVKSVNQMAFVLFEPQRQNCVVCGKPCAPGSGFTCGRYDCVKLDMAATARIVGDVELEPVCDGCGDSSCRCDVGAES
jgi:hypothetical protein